MTLRKTVYEQGQTRLRDDRMGNKYEYDVYQEDMPVFDNEHL